jgi:branched-chain amino acid transport system ATP-binding protein
MMNVFDALKDINKEEGHGDPAGRAERPPGTAVLATRGYVLENGNLVLDGNSSDLLNDPEVQKAYLGG